MSREIRRVPLGFDWPLDKVWEGYLPPETLRPPVCPACQGQGWSPTAQKLEATFYTDGPNPGWGLDLNQADVDHLLSIGYLRHFNSTARRWEARAVRAAEVNAVNQRGNLFHDLSLDAGARWHLVQFRCTQRGVDPRCATCTGTGDIGSAAQRDAWEAWERTEPPAGEGWQLWETVSEGSPQTPVFARAADLVDYLVAHEGFRRAAAETLVAAGSTIGSMVLSDGVLLRSDIDADRIHALSRKER